MALQEYIQIDLETGRRLDVALFDSETDEIPDDYKLGWGNGRVFYDAVWDFDANDWKEGKSFDEILLPYREAKCVQLSQECEATIKDGFYSGDDYFAFQDKDQANFNQQLSLMIVDDTIDEVLWKTENNGIKLFTRQQFINICKEGERHKRFHIGRFWQIKEYVLTHPFKSIEEVQAVTYGTGIPS